MEQYFDKQEHRDALKAEIARWKGTHFIYNTNGKASPEAGADCISFPINIYKNIGLISPDYETPPYLSVRSGPHELVKIYKGIDTMSTLKLIWNRDDFDIKEYDPYFGDLIICSSGRVIHHCVVVTENGYGVHCWPEQGVCKVFLGIDKIQKFARRAYRWYE